jgi:AraC-like DNA-binding protein
MNQSILIAVLGGVAVLNSLFLAAYLLIDFRSQLKNRLLALLFISLAVRIGKSLLIVGLSNTPDVFVSIGLLGMISTGPLLFLYLKHFDSASDLNSQDLAHFIPLLLTVIGVLLNNELITYWLYAGAVIQLATYLIICYRMSRKPMGEDQKKLINTLIICLAVIQLIYSSQLLIESRNAYVVVTSLAAAVLYVILFAAIRLRQVFLPVRKTAIPQDRLFKICEEVISLIEKESLFTQTDLTLQKVAERLKVKPYLISQAVNAGKGRTFPELINDYRIRKAQQMLINSNFDHFSIEAISFECGFNTPSAFYASFKKLTGLTPGEYKAGKKQPVSAN